MSCLSCVTDINEFEVYPSPCAYYKCDEALAADNLIDKLGLLTLTRTSGGSSVSGVIEGARDILSAEATTSNQCFSLQQSGGSIAFWFKEDTGSTGEPFFYKGDARASGPVDPNLEWVITLITTDPSGPSQVDLRIYHTDDSSTIASITGGAASWINQGDHWFFFIAWVDKVAETVNIRIIDRDNSSNDATASVSYTGKTPRPIVSSTFETDGGVISAVIDEVGLYDRVLSTAEQDFLYNSGAGRTYPW